MPSNALSTTSSGRTCTTQSPRSVASASSCSVCHCSILSVRPLNVLPSITNRPGSVSGRGPGGRVGGAEGGVGDAAAAGAGAPLDGEDDEVERVHRLDLQPAGAAAAGGVRRVE